MRHFHRHDGELHVERVPLQKIAEQLGTPTYVYSRAAIREHFGAYADALSGCKHLVCYAVKANSNLGVLGLLAQQGAGFDIVSVGELERVLRAGGRPDRIVFSGVGKQPYEMARALEAGIRCFNVESAAELVALDAIARAANRTAPVSLRINPDVDASTHAYIATGLRENKFGIAISDAKALYRKAATLAGIEVVGVDCHIGSQLTRIEPFLAALDRVLCLVDELAAEGIPLDHIDLGGGLGVRYRDETPPPIADYVAALRERMGRRPHTLIIEPGRSIIASAGALLTRVIYLKHSTDRNFAIVDAAMNDLIRPALYQAWMAIEAVAATAAPPDTYDIVGPVCETGDFLGKDRALAIAAGDLLCVQAAGAYGFTMSSNYNSRPRAAEAIVDGDRVHLVRERESITDLMRGEHLLAE